MPSLLPIYTSQSSPSCTLAWSAILLYAFVFSGPTQGDNTVDDNDHMTTTLSNEEDGQTSSSKSQGQLLGDFSGVACASFFKGTGAGSTQSK